MTTPTLDPTAQPGPLARTVRTAVQVLLSLAAAGVALEATDYAGIPVQYRDELAGAVGLVGALVVAVTAGMAAWEARRGAPLLTTPPATNTRKARQLEELGAYVRAQRDEALAIGAGAAAREVLEPTVGLPSSSSSADYLEGAMAAAGVDLGPVTVDPGELELGDDVAAGELAARIRAHIDAPVRARLEKGPTVDDLERPPAP